MGRRNSTRDRQAAELRALRLLVQELETRLTQPRSVSTRRGRSRWRGVAERQRFAVALAQEENRRLLEEAQCRADWIERFWALLCETKHFDLVHEARENARAVDWAVLMRLKRESLRTGCWETALEAFEANGAMLVDSAEQKVDDRWIVKTNSSRGRVCLVAQRLLPFDALATTEATWTMLTAVGTTCSNVTVLERSQTIHSMKYDINEAILQGNIKPTIRCHAVVQTLVPTKKNNATHWQNGLSLFAWHSISSVSCQGFTASSKDIVWVAISSNPDEGSLGSVMSIVLETQMDPLSSDCPLFFDSVVRAGECCVAEMLDTTENLLLDSGNSSRRKKSEDLGVHVVAV